MPTHEVPWFTTCRRKDPDADALSLVRKLALYVIEHQHVLHRVDMWLDPSAEFKTATKRSRIHTRASKQYPVPLRVGDVLCYNFSYMPILTHSMIYVGGGYVVHYRPEMFSSDGAIDLAHIDVDFNTSQRRRMYVCPRNGYTRLPRCRVALRALITVGKYNQLDPKVNCQHVVERILGNAWFSIGIPRAVFTIIAIGGCVLGIMALAERLRAKPWSAPSTRRPSLR